MWGSVLGCGWRCVEVLGGVVGRVYGVSVEGAGKCGKRCTGRVF